MKNDYHEFMGYFSDWNNAENLKVVPDFAAEPKKEAPDEDGPEIEQPESPERHVESGLGLTALESDPTTATT
jgi:hypothetical protein